MTNPSNSLGTGPSAFVAESSKNPSPSKPNSPSDQKTAKVFGAVQVFPGQSVDHVSSESPFQVVGRKRPENPLIPEPGCLVERLPEDNPGFVNRVAYFLNLFSKSKEEIRNGMDSFLEGDLTFNPVESSSQDVSQSGQDRAALGMANKLIVDLQEKWRILEEIDAEIPNIEDSKKEEIQVYLSKLKRHSVGYTDPDIRTFIEEQKNLDPQSPLILGLERVNITNEEINKAYNFLEAYIKYDM